MPGPKAVRGPADVQPQAIIVSTEDRFTDEPPARMPRARLRASTSQASSPVSIASSVMRWSHSGKPIRSALR